MDMYTCDICGVTGPWDEAAWAWFGSLLDLEEKGLQGITITCSAACRAEFERDRDPVPFLEVT